jgi:uncharacterized protein YecE (DUF72 family)
MIYIGTSGWHYQHWKGNFYPKDIKNTDYLDHYLKTFDTVEINNSFYRLPDVGTLENWREKTPNHFIFSVKASRYITHIKKLKDPEKGVDNFLQVVKHLKKKLGPVLFQLPPGWKRNPQRLQQFLEYLPSGYRYTFEFRNKDWFTEEIDHLLQAHNCAFCIYDLKRSTSPEKVTADFVYIRLHGPGNAYEGSYSRKTLQKWAKKIQQWQQARKDVYCYFDNDQSGYAPNNALLLKQLLS